MPPNQRFQETALYFKDEILAILDDYFTIIPDILVTIFKYGGFLIEYQQPEYYQEIVGMASVLGIETSKALVANYIYEVSAYCTSIVARSPSGEIIHERVLDFDFPNQTRALTY